MDQSINSEFVVTIPVKPYVKRFIELSYGLPADFSKSKEIQEMIHRYLKKPCTRYDRKYNTFQLSKYSENIEIVISKYYYNHYGCEFSITDSIEFGRYFEFKAKDEMNKLIEVSLSLGKSLKTSIVDIRERLGFDESQWKYESIKKDFNKHRSIYGAINLKEEIYKSVMNLLFEKEWIKKKKT